MAIVAVSGGFSIIHAGHIRLIKGAFEYGNVIVILNSDEWMERKYGKVIVPYEQREEILKEIKGVLDVVSVDDSDGTVCKTLEILRPDYFANGGDRVLENTPEFKLCRDLGIKTLFGVGGDKIESSSRLIYAIQKD